MFVRLACFVLVHSAFAAAVPLPEAASKSLQAKHGVHPRLFFTDAKLEALKRSIQGPNAANWQAVKKRADAIAAQHPPRYREDNDPAQLWQRDVGNSLPFLALAYRLTGEPRYLNAAKEWSLACSKYPHWGTGKYEDSDLPAGHQLLGLALVYDWLYRNLDPATLETIRHALAIHGQRMYRASDTMFWRNEFMQNHLWVNMTGLAAAGFALFDEPGFETTATGWLALCHEKFRLSDIALGPDGASQEGVSYWGYAVEVLLKYWQMAGDLFNEKPASTWWRNTALYKLYLTLPKNAWSRQLTSVDLSDYSNPPAYGPDYILRRLASLNRDGQAQRLAAEFERAGLTTPTSGWLNLLWFDPAVAEKPTNALPTMHRFEDMDIVSARSDWSGNESLLVFKCGPALGHRATRDYDFDIGGGHAHPDANHFVLFANGEWLIRDDGYMWKMTDQHNTLLIDGNGQMGEGGMWFGKQQAKLKPQPLIFAATSSAELDEMAGDAAQAYPAEMGLRRFKRRVLFLKPDVLIIADDIELAAPHKLELRLHPQFKAARAAEGSYLARGAKAVLRIQPLTPDGVAISDGDLPARDRDGKSVSLYALKFEKQAAKWRHAVALSWSAAGQEPPTVRVEQQSERWIIHAGNRTAVLNWQL